MENKSYFHRVEAQTPTKFWINNVTREQADLAISSGAVGCTQNPSYVWKMLNTSDEEERNYVYSTLDGLMTAGDASEVEVALQRRLVEGIADKFMPIYESSKGKYGYVSIQGNPFKEDADSIIKYALFNTENKPNMMAKIPVTEDGLEAIRYLSKKRIPINATEVMSVAQAMDVCETYRSATSGMLNPAPIFYSHIAGIFDEEIRAQAEENKIDIDKDYLWQAGIIVAKKVYGMTKEKYPEVGFISGGARGLHHFTEMVGADAVVTINWSGTADKLIEQDGPVIQRFSIAPAYSVVDDLCEKLLVFRKAYFRCLLKPEEYETFPPVVRFRNSFEKAWTSSKELIEQRMG